MTGLFPHRAHCPDRRAVRRTAVLLGGLLAVALAGCSGPTRVAIRALPPVNANAEGESLPVEVRIYALRDDARFRSVPIDELWTNDRMALGDDRLQDPKVMRVPPSGPDSAPVAVELGEFPKDTRFIGVFALIQNPDQPDRRRAVVPSVASSVQVIELLDGGVAIHDDGAPPPAHAKSSSPSVQPAKASP